MMYLQNLFCPSIHCLNKMFYICEQFASIFCITFNCKKTECINCGDPVCPDEIASINGSVIKWVDHVRHLGNYVLHL